MKAPATEEPSGASVAEGEAAGRLRLLRSDLGLSQKVLAERAGISLSVVSRIERGKQFPTPYTRARLAAALGMKPVVLFPSVNTNRGGFGPQLRAREGGRLLCEARLTAVMSQRELATRASVSQGHVSSLEVLADWGVRPGPAERIARALGRDVDELFEPAGKQSGRAGRAQRPSKRVERCEVRYAEQMGYVTVAEAAGVLNVRERTVHGYVERGLLAVKEKRVRHLLFEQRAVRARARARYTCTDPSVQRSYDPRAVLEQSLASGKTLAQARQAADRARKRRDDDALNRTGVAGRKPSTADRNAEWVAEWKALWQEHNELHDIEQSLGLPGSPPTRLGVAALVAQRRFDAHLDRWPNYSPYDLPDAAARVVWEAIKPLLSPVI